MNNGSCRNIGAIRHAVLNKIDIQIVIWGQKMAKMKFQIKTRTGRKALTKVQLGYAGPQRTGIEFALSALQCCFMTSALVQMKMVIRKFQETGFLSSTLVKMTLSENQNFD